MISDIESAAEKPKLTWELLDKDENLLTPIERKLVENHREELENREKELERANQNLIKTCKIVTGGYESYLIPAAGWIYPVTEMAYAIETLNILYKKYRLYANFDQCKEKYANFRGYYTIHTAEDPRYQKLVYPFKKLHELLHKKIDYAQTTTILEPAHHTKEWKIIRDDSETQTGFMENKVVLADGSNTKLVSVLKDIKAQSITRPTKHRILWMLRDPVAKIFEFVKTKLNFLNAETLEMQVIRERFDNQVSDLVSICEAECRKRCIRCGAYIENNGYSTKGWYTYICERCASLSRGGIKECYSLEMSRRMEHQRIFEIQLSTALKVFEPELDETATAILSSATMKLGSHKEIKKRFGVPNADNELNDEAIGCC